jgi:Autotransporter beta-domain
MSRYNVASAHDWRTLRRMRSNYLLTCSAAIALAFSNPSLAAWELSAHGNQGSIEATERLQGRLLNTESGTLRGQSIELTHRWPSLSALHLNVARMAGTVNHLGLTQTGLPFASTSALDLHQTSLGFSQNFPLASGWALQPSANLIQDSWHRSIATIGFIQGLQEALKTTSIESGLKFSYRWRSSFGETLLSSYLGVSRPIANQLNVSLGAPYDNHTLSPNKRWSQRFNVGIEQALNSAVHLSLRWEHEIFRVGSSASTQLSSGGTNVGSTSYPGAERKHAVLSAGLRLLW